MTSAPYADGPGQGESDLPGGDLGVGGPAEETGDPGDGPTQPEGYPEQVDPAQGPVTGSDRIGDLLDPGAH